MPNVVRLTAESPHALANIRSAFADGDYWRARLDLNEAGAPTLDTLTTDAGGTTTMQMTMRFGGDQLPAVLRPLRLGALKVVQHEVWEPTADGLHGTIGVTALRTPISGRGIVDLESDGAGTRLTGTATVDVRVPLFGGPIAGFLTAQLADAIREIVRVTDRWLDRRS